MQTFKAYIQQPVAIELNAFELFALTGGNYSKFPKFVPGGKYQHTDGRIAYCVLDDDGNWMLEDEDGKEVFPGLHSQWTWIKQLCG